MSIIYKAKNGLRYARLLTRTDELPLYVWSGNSHGVLKAYQS